MEISLLGAIVALIVIGAIWSFAKLSMKMFFLTALPFIIVIAVVVAVLQ